MDSDTNYTLVGLFVVIFTAGVLGFAYWLAKSGGQEEYAWYQVFMTESVAGLTTDSAVKYQGVDVGTVAKLELDQHNPERVHLLLKIRRSTPMKTDTTATLMFYGITGLAFIELQGGSQGQLLESTANNRPVIPTKPSTITRLDSALSELATKSTRVLDRIDRLLSDENLGNLAATLQHAPAMLQNIDQLTRNATAQLDDVHRLLKKGLRLEGDFSKTLKSVSQASNRTGKLASTLQHTYGALGEEARQTIEPVSGMTQQLYEDIKTLISEIQATVEAWRSRPADILFSHSLRRPGPGEEIPQ